MLELPLGVQVAVNIWKLLLRFQFIQVFLAKVPPILWRFGFIDR